MSPRKYEQDVFGFDDEDDDVIKRRKKKKRSSKGREKGYGLDMSMPIEDEISKGGGVASDSEEQAMNLLEESNVVAPIQVVEQQSEVVNIDEPQSETVVPETSNETQTEAVEEENAEERLDYLRTDLIGDLRLFYGDARVSDQDRKAAEDRLEKNGIKRFYYFDKKQKVDRRDWKSGNVVIAILGKFFSMDDGFPDEWKGSEELVQRMGIENNDLIEARKRKIDVVENGPTTEEINEDEEVEITSEKEYIWYDGIIEDLRKVTDKGVDFDVRVETAKKLRESGVRLPILSDDEDDIEGNSNRIMLGSAVDFLEGGSNNRWGTKEAAIEWLRNDLGISREGSDNEPVEVEITNLGDKEKIDFRGHEIEFVRSLDKEFSTYTGLKGDLFLLRLKNFRNTLGFDVVEKRLAEHGVDVGLSLGLIAD